MSKFLDQAAKNAKTDEDKLEVEYYSTYLRKLQAIQEGNQANFEKSNERMLELCEQEHPIAMVNKYRWRGGIDFTWKA